MHAATSTFLLLLFASTLRGQDPAAATAPPWHRARAVWFGDGASVSIAAEVGVGFEAVPFDDGARLAFDGAKPGERIALGRTVWSTLETFTALDCGGVAVASGQYYAALERTADGWALALLDADAVRAKGLLPSGATVAPALVRLPLRAAADGSGTAVAADWQLRDGGARLHLQVGPHELVTDVRVEGSAGAFPLAQPEARRCSRLAFAPAKDDAQRFAAVDHGAPPWNDERDAAVAAMPVGGRWRLGQDWPTTLEINAPITLGGKRLAAGSWHLTLAKAKGGRWNLIVSDARADFAAKIDGFAPEQVRTVLEVPLRAARAPSPAGALSVEFAREGNQAQLAITFGELRLDVPLGAAKGRR